MITTNTIARTLADLSLKDWHLVARCCVFGEWVWELPIADQAALMRARETGRAETVQRRDPDGMALLAKWAKGRR